MAASSSRDAGWPTQPAAAGAVVPEAPWVSTGQSPINVLLVDDEPRNLDVLESILACPEHRLVRAQTSDEALLALLQGDYAAIVLDVRMPGISGFELAQLIKQRKRNQHTPILFLTAYFQEQRDVLQGYGAGAVDYLTKPVDPQILKSKVGVFVDLFRTTRALAAANAALESEVARRQEVNAALQAEIQAHKEAAAARDQLAVIVETSSDAIWSRALDGTVISWNQGAERLFGYSASEIVGQPNTTLVPPDRVDETSMLEDSLKCAVVLESLETVRLRKDGQPLEVSLTLSPIKNAAGKVTAISVIARDISERKRAEKALHESQTRLQAIMNHSPAMIFLKDTAGRYLHCNREFERAFGLRQQEAVGKTDAELFPSRQAAAFHANDLKVAQAGRAMVFEETAQHDDGTHISIVTKFPLTGRDGKLFAIGGIVTDITERRQLEADVLQISEREQRRISHDLHDGLGQELAGISCLCNVLHRNLAEQSSPEAANAARISRLLDAAVGQTRSLARGLYPVVPEPDGLMSALSGLAIHVRRTFKVVCMFHCRRAAHIENKFVATHLYRIAQEAVTNALKHGQAHYIDIELEASSRKITLTVNDDGIGFPDSSPSAEGLGLRIMNYRASIIGATVSIRRRPRGGTTVVCVAKPWPPLNEDEAALPLSLDIRP